MSIVIVVMRGLEGFSRFITTYLVDRYNDSKSFSFAIRSELQTGPISLMYVKISFDFDGCPDLSPTI